MDGAQSISGLIGSTGSWPPGRSGLFDIEHHRSRSGHRWRFVPAAIRAEVLYIQLVHGGIFWHGKCNSLA
jgi:hypothetical protein